MSRPEDRSLHTGIKRRFTDNDGFIVGPTWYRAFEGKDVVGTCRERECDGLMVALPNDDEGRHVWYGAECLSCGHEIAQRSDKSVVRRSSRQQEMPQGFWEPRVDLLTRLADLAKKSKAQAA